MMKDDLISRSALLERLAFKRMGSMQRNTYPGLESAIAQVKKAPAVDAEKVCKQIGLVKEAMDMAKADLVAVVRCSDCAVPHNRWTGCPNLNGLIPPDDFFCARGERKVDHAD